MTKRELVLCALQHIETEKLPYHVEATAQLDAILKDYFGKDIIEEAGSCLEYIQYWGYPAELPDRPEYFKDDFGVVWNRTGADKDIGVISEPIIAEPDISLYPTPYLNEARIREECERLASSRKDAFKFYGIGFSLFERLWSYCGMENALVYMATEPEFTEQLLDKICDFNLKVIEIVNEYKFDGFYFGDDWGSQTGLIMGPTYWRKYIKPRLKRMYDAAHKDGKYVLQHSCGNILDVFPDLIEIGLNCYQTFQPEIYDVAAVKEKYGKELCFWGGVSTQRLLPYATADQIREEIRKLNGVMRKGGGYILAPTHAMPADIPPENVKVMIDEFIHQN